MSACNGTSAWSSSPPAGSQAWRMCGGSGRWGLYGAIIGKAYYTGDIDLREAVEAAR